MRLRRFLIILACMASASAFGATGSVVAKVTSILTDDSNYGGCMAYLSVNPATVLPACGGSWITFDCLASLPTSTKSTNLNKYSAAQLAYVTNGNLFVSFNDAKKINGFCYAERVDNR